MQHATSGISHPSVRTMQLETNSRSPYSKRARISSRSSLGVELRAKLDEQYAVRRCLVKRLWPSPLGKVKHNNATFEAVSVEHRNLALRGIAIKGRKSQKRNIHD